MYRRAAATDSDPRADRRIFAHSCGLAAITERDLNARSLRDWIASAGAGVWERSRSRWCVWCQPRWLGRDFYALPVETLTFPFTDIEGSTALLRRLGEGVYAQVLADHHALIRSGLAAHGAQEVDTQGDAFFAAFSSPKACVAAVLQMRTCGETAVHVAQRRDRPDSGEGELKLHGTAIEASPDLRRATATA
jgi:class 3 adenylate cyclase